MKAMLSFREKLPAFKVKSEFLKAIASNQVCSFSNFLFFLGINRFSLNVYIFIIMLVYSLLV